MTNLLLILLLVIGCVDDTPSTSIVGEWERTFYSQQLEVIFHENGAVNASAIDEDGTTQIPEHTYTIDGNIITLIGICNAESSEWNYVMEGNYSYSINDEETMLTLTLINDECQI